MQLEPCPECRRHVKICESSCPFCGRGLASAFAEIAPRRAPPPRLGRAATLAFGLATLGACTDSSAPPDAQPAADAGTDATIPADADYDFDGGTPIYAAAPTDGTTPKRG